jgi:hypothetical protein
MTVSNLDIETAIHETMSLVIALAELVDTSLVEPDRLADGLAHFSMTLGQVDARLAMTTLVADKTVALRDLFQAYTRCERERKAAKP